MKRFLHKLSVRQIILGISGIVSLLIFLIFCLVIHLESNTQVSQQMADRWSEDKNVSQVSCFFSANVDITPDSIEQFRHTLDAALLEASIIQESPNTGARLWADAYSADGKITLKSDRTALEADAVGIGGDYFLFHPLTLLYGSYFSGNDLMQDYCIIDEDAAWQLFGSSDVAGMSVTIGDIPHIITGVVRREEGYLYEAAGLNSTLVYVSHDTLSTLGRSNGINHYEIVMPSPVSQYAYNYVKEKIGVDEREMEVVENTTRYSLANRLKGILAVGTRSMNGKAIIYPYWENVARGYEDILNILTFLSIFFLLYPLTLLVICLVILWKHKTWTFRSVWNVLRDKWERILETKREKRKSKKMREKS